jgi:hypothetical protein
MISLAAPPCRDIIRDNAAIGIVYQVRTFEVDEPAREALQALVGKPTDDLRPLLPRPCMKLAAQFEVAVGNETARVDLKPPPAGLFR